MKYVGNAYNTQYSKLSQFHKIGLQYCEKTGQNQFGNLRELATIHTQHTRMQQRGSGIKETLVASPHSSSYFLLVTPASSHHHHLHNIAMYDILNLVVLAVVLYLLPAGEVSGQPQNRTIEVVKLQTLDLNPSGWQTE